VTSSLWSTRDGPGQSLALALPFLLAVVGLSSPAEGARPKRYALAVRINPDRRHLAVSGHVSVQLEKGESAFSFELHDAFHIARCAIDGEPERCTPVQPVPEGGATVSRRITVELPKGVGGDLVDLEIAYAGELRDRPSWGTPGANGPFMDDAVGPDRVELALYSSWYPSFGFGPTYDVEVDVTVPRGWSVACIGGEEERRETAEETTTRWTARSVNDVVIVGSPQLRSKDITTSAGRVRISHTRLPETFLLREARETERTLGLFATLLQDSPGGRTVQHVYSPRRWGQGFARPGLIVMSEGRVLEALEKEPETSLLYGHAHEAAHFWWRFGSGQGDWINETFAEYFALIAIREIQGENAFRRALDERRERVRGLPADAPALAVVPAFSGGDGYTIRYEKGALMLEAFRSHLGDNAFFDTCRRFYERFNGRSAGTDDFRAFWSAALKDDAPLESWLDSSGPGPSAPTR